MKSTEKTRVNSAKNVTLYTVPLAVKLKYSCHMVIGKVSLKYFVELYENQFRLTFGVYSQVISCFWNVTFAINKRTLILVYYKFPRANVSIQPYVALFEGKRTTHHYADPKSRGDNLGFRETNTLQNKTIRVLWGSLLWRRRNWHPLRHIDCTVCCTTLVDSEDPSLRSCPWTSPLQRLMHSLTDFCKKKGILSKAWFHVKHQSDSRMKLWKKWHPCQDGRFL